MGQVAEVSTGNITGFQVAAGALKVNGTAVASGTYSTVGSLATAINTAAGSTVASVDSNGELKIDNSAGTAAVAFTGAGATTLGLGSVASGATADSTGAAAAVTALPSLASETLSINGTNVDLSGAKSLQDMSDAINAAGITGVSAAVNAAGNGLNFYSSTALTVDDSGTSIIGKNATDANTGNAYTNDTAAATGGSLATGSVATVDQANDLISRVDVALKTVSDFAAQLGAVQNRFQSTISTVAAQTTNLQASQSTIQDADFAAETANLSKAQVLQQAGISVLAQANSNPQQVLKLLQ
jgi:flagellin